MLGLGSLADLARLGSGLVAVWWGARPFSRVNPLVALILLVKPPWLGVLAFALAAALGSSGLLRRGLAFVAAGFLGFLLNYGVPASPPVLAALVALGTLGWIWRGGRLGLGDLGRLGLAAAGLALAWKLFGSLVSVGDPWISFVAVLLAATIPEFSLSGAWGALAGPVPALIGLGVGLSLKAHKLWGRGVAGGLAPYLGSSALVGKFAFAFLGPGFGVGAGLLALTGAMGRFPRLLVAIVPLAIPVFLKNPWLYLLFAPLSLALLALPRLSPVFSSAWSFALAAWAFLMPYSLARVPPELTEVFQGKAAYREGRWAEALALLWDKEPLLAARAAAKLGENPLPLYAKAGAFEEMLSFLEARGTPEEAVAWGRRALSEGFIGPKVLEALAWGNLALGKFPKARLFSLKSYFLGNPDALVFLGDLTGKPTLFKRAIKEGSNLRRAYKLLARAHLYRGDTARALKYLKWE